MRYKEWNRSVFHLNRNAAGWKRGKQFENHDFMFVFMGSTGELVRTSESTDSVKCGICYITAGSPFKMIAVFCLDSLPVS